VPYYRTVGAVPRKRHTFHRDADGALLAEELMGQEGFSSSSTLLYHRHSPSAILEAASVSGPQVTRSPLEANEGLLPWHVRAPSLTAGARGDLVTGRHVLFGNSSITIAWAAASETSGLYRNAAGDEVVYVQSGRGALESVFGSLDVGPGDYVVIPASTTHRWAVIGDDPVNALVVEGNGHIGPPAKYLSATGQFLEHAPYCERDLRSPSAPIEEAATGVPVLVRHRQGWAKHVHAHHPFDVVGWDGCVYPYALSIHDFEPIVGRVHQPPPVHQTFAGPGFVICSFVPRPFDWHPEAVKVPYHHANTDSDEVLFYSAGDFMSRKGAGIGVGSLTLHPAGFVHGPQPGSVEAAIGVDRTDELAVMIDTFQPLLVSEDARRAADPGYPWTWAARG
jgi:homogentisate 1,2-dioxygenase